MVSRLGWHLGGGGRWLGLELGQCHLCGGGRWLGLGLGQCHLRGGGDGDEGGDVFTLEEALTNLEGSGDLLHGEIG